MKKILAALAVSLAVFSCSNPMELGQDTSLVGGSFRALTAPGVELVLVNSYVHYKYYGTLGRSITARVYPKGTNTQVLVHHQKSDGTWIDIPAEFSEKLPDGTELWTAGVYGSDKGTQFVVKAVLDGSVYYDNNNGQNYDVPLNFGTYLKNGINVRQSWAYTGSGSLSGVIDIRNLAYTKSVNIVYTTDGWATTRVARASYNGPYFYYGYSTTQSPNAAGIEKWNFSISAPGASGFEYAISYDVNGQTFWDNNYGRNYKYSVY